MKSGVAVTRDAIDPCDEWQSHARATKPRLSRHVSIILCQIVAASVPSNFLFLPRNRFALLIYASQPPIEICIKTFPGRSTLARPPSLHLILLSSHLETRPPLSSRYNFLHVSKWINLLSNLNLAPFISIQRDYRLISTNLMKKRRKEREKKAFILRIFFWKKLEEISLNEE